MAAATDLWCQGWSEPNAGSDLASLTCKATRDDDRGGWVLDGQKTWTTRGAFCTHLFGLFRTDPDSSRHQGLTYLLVPLDVDGVTVRGFGRLDGDEGFAPVRLTAVTRHEITPAWLGPAYLCTRCGTSPTRSRAISPGALQPQIWWSEMDVRIHEAALPWPAPWRLVDGRPGGRRRVVDEGRRSPRPDLQVPTSPVQHRRRRARPAEEVTGPPCASLHR
jgi:hypothetical protein